MRDLPTFLSEIHSRLIQENDIGDPMDELIRRLQKLRNHGSKDGWSEIVEISRNHPIREVLHQDPFLEWSYRKPRGHSGDAALLDYIYGVTIASDCTPLGKKISDHMVGVAECASARWRKDYLSTLIDEICSQQEKPHILSVACGHLREANKSEAVQNQTFGRFVAFDQDKEAIQLIKDELSDLGEEPVVGSVRQLITGKPEIGQFDLIYAAGLYDYLQTRIAARLTEALFAVLKPGGLVLIPQFLTHVPTSGFIEVFMDWHMIYRTLEELEDLSMTLPELEIEDRRMFRDPSGFMGYLEIHKK